MADLFELASDAMFSPCGRYRYRLRRQLRPHGGRVCLFVMLNPSKANATDDDPTIRRCIGFARAWDFDWLKVVNLFALTATDPAEMLRATDPVGPDNDPHLRGEAGAADLVVCAWGKHGSHLGRDRVVADLLYHYDLHCLGTNKDGSPKHPLYCRADTQPMPWRLA